MWEQFLARGNLAEALRRVEQNAGAPGIDGMSTKELRPWLKDHWSEVRSELDAGTYRPQPVRRVMIPKSSGGLRMLGVPAAVDRLICQAIAQVLTPIFDPEFHPHSFGFRPGRSQHDAVKRARQFIADDAAWCVDFDLDSFLWVRSFRGPLGYPKVKTYASTPGSRNVTSNVRSVIDPGWRSR